MPDRETRTWNDLVVWTYWPEKMEVFKFHIGILYQHLPPEYKAVYAYNIMKQAKADDIDMNLFKVPKNVRQDFSHIGDGEIENGANIPLEAFRSGFLYTKPQYQVIQPDASVLWGDRESEYFFPQEISMNLNDCIIHAINFCLRFPWFVRREQVQKLAEANEKKSAARIKKFKALAGYMAEDFTNFAVHDDRALSLKEIKEI